jgi:hypothetical protein
MKQEKIKKDVYVSSTGKYYYPKPITKAKIKMNLETAKEKGFKPSKSYLKFLEKLAKEQK